MGRGLDQLTEIKEDSLDYLKLKWRSLRLEAIDSISTALSGAFGKILGILLVLTSLTFLMVGLSLWLGELLGEYWAGFLISGGVFLLMALVAFFVGHRFVSGGIIRFLITLLFPEKDDEDYE